MKIQNKYILTGMIALVIIASYFLQGSPTGNVVFDSTIENNTLFTNSNISLFCSGSSTSNIENISVTIFSSSGNSSQVINASGLTNSSYFYYNVSNDNYQYQCTICDNTECLTTELLEFSVNDTSYINFYQPVINLTFDNDSEPWKDYSNLTHTIDIQGDARHEASSFCKWYSCLDLSENSGDYIRINTTKFGVNNGLAISFWMYLNNTPTGGSSQSYVSFGDPLQYLLEGDYGMDVRFKDKYDEDIFTNLGISEKTLANIWNHYFIQYNNSNLIVWKNGVIVRNVTPSTDKVQSFYEKEFVIGKGIYDINTPGYFDEVLVWNRGNFSNQEVLNRYNEQREGTPAELDLVIDSITYTLPYDFSQVGNPISDDPLEVTITVSNLGNLFAANNIEVELILEGNQECIQTISLGPLSTQNISCILDLDVGQWYDGVVTVDSNNEVDETAYFGGSETNNEYVFYVPFESHPRLRFNQNEWDTTIYPFITNSSNSISYSAYNWHRSFVSENFNPSWSSSDVDPRGKKGYENALNCFINDYNSPTACEYARNHLDGWLLDVDDWDTGSVQAVHDIIHVGATYDLMFPNLTQDEVRNYSQGLAEACLAIYGKSNVQPHNDPEVPSPENGFGFSSGMAGACFSVLGDYIDNPTLAWDDPQSTTPINSVFYWNQRMIKYLQGLKNDSEAIYPEGMLYTWYSRYHVVDILWFLKRTEITTTVQDFQPVICSFAKEAAYNLLDHTYSGSALRGDEGNTWRQVSYGDTNSYENVGSDGLLGWDVITAYGLLCDEQEVKDIALELRDLGHSTGDQTDGTGTLYYYPLLYQDANPIDSVSERLNAYTFSSAFDRMTLRRGFTYENDSVFIFEGGDEANFGHPNAEFTLFSYAFGEPFLDFNQVPYNDDVRSEVWANTISFSQSTSPGYDDDPRSAVLHQHYGGSEITGTYPYFYYQPDGYRGDVLYSLGTSDGNFAALHAYHPYETTTSDPIRDVIIFDDLLIHVDKVHRTTSGPIYANWINIYDEFPSTLSGSNLTLQRAGTNKYYEINGLWSSAGSISLTGGDSSQAYCFYKTSCNGGLGNYGKYYHEVQGPDAVTLFAHHWYENDRSENITLYDGTDKGVQTTNKTIIFDTNEDGSINESVYDTNGYALAFTTNIVAGLGALSASKDDTEIFSSNNRGSFYIQTPMPGIINATISVEEESTISLSLPGAASATLDINGENIHSSQFTVGSDIITFTLPEGNNQVYINQEGDAPPSVSANAPSSNQQFYSDTTQVVSFSCLGTDDQLIDTISIQTNRSGTLTTLQSISPSSAGGVLSFDETFGQGIYSWRCSVTDNASQTTTSSLQLFSVSPVPIILPDVSAFNGRTTDFSALPSLENQSGIVLEDLNQGFLNFTGNISTLDGVNLSTSIEIEPTYISVNTTTYPQLDVPACLEFYNVSFTTPRIKRDGVVFTSYTNLSYVNGTLSFCVPGFSTYLIEETPTSTPDDDDDSGSSGSSGGGGGGGGGGSSGGGGSFSSGSSTATNESENETVQVFGDEETQNSQDTFEDEQVVETQQPSQEVQPEQETPTQVTQEESTQDIFEGSRILGGAIVLFAAIFAVIAFIKKRKKSHTAHLLDKYKFK